MKKIIYLFTIVLMMLGLFACETERSNSETGDTTSTVEQKKDDDKKGTTSTTINNGGESTTSTTIKNSGEGTTSTTIRYNIAFDSNGGTGTMDRLSVANDEIVSLPKCIFTKTGYKFIEWNDKKDGTGLIYDDETSVLNLSASLGATVKLFAQWESISYKVRYDANGGSGSMAEQNFVYDVEQKLNDNAFTAPTGKKFGSWNIVTDGTGTAYSNGENVSNLTSVSNDIIILYAQWIDKTAHSISYLNIKNADNTSNPQSFLESSDVTLTSLSVTGWTFEGWYDNENCNGEAINGWSSGSKNDDVILWAKWTADTVNYTVKTYFQTVDGLSYELSGTETKSGLTESTTKETAEDNITGFELQPIEQQIIAANGSTEVEIKYNRKSVTYTFKANGGNWSGNTADKTINDLYGAEVNMPADPTRTGYSFSDWDSDVPSEFGEDSETFTAQWTVNTYTVTLSNDGDVIGDTSITATYDSVLPTLQTCPSKLGYTFSGYWTAENGNGIKYIDADGVGTKLWNIDDDTTLYASFVPVAVNYTVKKYFQNTAGTGYEQNLSVYPNQTKSGLTGSTTNESAANNITGFELQPIEQQIIAANGSTEVEIKYNRKSVTYTFKANGGNWNGSTADKIVSGLYGATVSKPADPARTNYTFNNWDNNVPNIYGSDNLIFTANWTAEWYVNNDGNFVCGDTVCSKSSMRQILSNTTRIGCDMMPTNTHSVFRQKRTGGVDIDKYAIGKYPVTQQLYIAVMGENPSRFLETRTPCDSTQDISETNTLLRPVEQVSWYEAIVFCNKLSILMGKTRCYKLSDGTYPDEAETISKSDNNLWKNATCDWSANGYRLPTECEWECAARGGIYSTTTPWRYTYSGGENINDVAWYESNSNDHTWEVGLKAANTKDLYDMCGNVKEWCWDSYSDSITQDTPATGPGIPSSNRAVRGGDFNNGYNDCKVSDRNGVYAYNTSYDRGFRLACISVQ